MVRELGFPSIEKEQRGIFGSFLLIVILIIVFGLWFAPDSTIEATKWIITKTSKIIERVIS